ncbi:C4-dicarboxylate ABC transporter permease [Jiangella aurantiaca]|uniref:C4-dicarboxylate ABC transporter permease n=1 Tax=Jiangella aurantiaca TaxID=2530373 RepID=A0A4V2YSU1_9ACTN|nr:tripartite tricarboxylate transporter permease [Jiangella aurantiaca]TDD71237.1 C4-dicarboxylate ABC transporter permease [Jiangella aurantiaca]
MEIFSSLLGGFGTLFSSPHLIAALAGAVVAGMVVGALPGLTATMAMALFLPFTFLMEPATGLAVLMGVFAGGIAGGSIPAILLNVPGTPASAATLLDGYPMTRKGRAGEALSMAMFASAVGGLVSALLMSVLAPVIARFALNFQAPEFFVLAIYGLTIIAAVAGKSLLKGYIAGLIGLVVGMVGLDPIAGQLRLTFGSQALYGGISLIPVLIGVFGITQALVMVRESSGVTERPRISGRTLVSADDLRSSSGTLVRGSLIGSGIGAIPGTGTDIGAFLSYSEARRRPKGRIPFGEGNPQGVAASESANNAVVGGSMIPTFTLGIPGEAGTAVLLGGLLIHGLMPGPDLFTGSQSSLVYTIFASFIVANVMILLLGTLAARLFVHVVRVPNQVLVPVILLFCMVGSYAINNRIADVSVTIVFGILGYVMVTHEFPVSPLVLGLILGPMAETNFRRAMTITHGDWTIFFTRPASLVFWALIVLSLVYVWRSARRRRVQKPAESEDGPQAVRPT